MSCVMQIVDGVVKIFIDGLLHLSFKREDLYLVHSYIEIDNEKYFIHLYIKEAGKIVLEYDSREKWEKIIKLVEKTIYSEWEK